MAARHPAVEQPDEFTISPANVKKIKATIAKYPKGRQQSAVIAALDTVQRQAGGWLPVPAMNAVAEILEMPYIRVYEVASFYTMFNLEPVGEFLVQVCRTTPCWLRGSDKLTNHCKKKFDINIGETSKDGKFTLIEVECLGACVNAPMVQINDDYYEDLTEDNFDELLDNLAAGKKVTVGTQVDRQHAAPVGGPTTLTDAKKATAAKKAPAKKATTKKKTTSTKKEEDK